ncbi:cytidylate kinase-like [Scomber scombrus]|uniref:cytidylate kinase-like n=1 Tax=Scomber scombrus TaxID=13677 RepID=UPI002DD8FFAA|nr:cytidylate kinase-like [Scomber scombrus]
MASRLPELKREFIITIDGPIGSGKSSVAQICVDLFGMAHLDITRLYKTVAYLWEHQPGVSWEDLANQAINHYVPDSELIDWSFWGKAVGVSKIKIVNEIITDHARAFTFANPQSVIEGIDVGSIISWADLKILCVAPLMIRRDRVYAKMVTYSQLKFKFTPEEFLVSLCERDHLEGYGLMPETFWINSPMRNGVVFPTHGICNTHFPDRVINLLNASGAFKMVCGHRVTPLWCPPT